MLNYVNNYLKKFAMEILPSVAATIIGAYIVNHYIVTKPGADAPVAAAVSAADPKADIKPDTKAVNTKAADAKPADAGNLPAAGVKAKGISEKAIFEKTAAERPTVVEKPQEKAEAKADAKPADAPVETASIPARHTPAPPRDKVRVVLPSPVQAVTPPVTAAVAPVPAPPVETASAPDERRDANDLARAAIERLRGSGDNSPRAPEVVRAPETPRIETPRVATVPALRPLPPPITVSTPGESPDQASSQARPPYAANAAIDPRRPTPPADIPVSRPLDLRAEVAEPSVREHTSVAEDVLSAAKSMFHAVLPK
jgi:hypothetical protein